MSLGNNDGTTAEESGSPRLSQRGAQVTLRVPKEKRGLTAFQNEGGRLSQGDQIARTPVPSPEF